MKKLYKSKTDRKVDGVCGGIAEYLNMDSTVIRLLWVLFSLAGGSGLLAYIVCCFVLPDHPDYIEE